MPQAKQLPWVSPEACEGCADCVSACPRRILQMNPTHHEGVYIPWLDAPQQCTGCGRCELVCTWGAIAMTGYVDDASARFLARRPLARTEKAEGTGAQLLSFPSDHETDRD